jgi:hypothetical protein
LVNARLVCEKRKGGNPKSVKIWVILFYFIFCLELDKIDFCFYVIFFCYPNGGSGVFFSLLADLELNMRFMNHYCFKN